MKFYEKYPKLQERAFLADLLTRTVFATMALENQEVPMPNVQEIVQTLLSQQELEGNQFFAD